MCVLFLQNFIVEKEETFSNSLKEASTTHF